MPAPGFLGKADIDFHTGQKNPGKNHKGKNRKASAMTYSTFWTPLRLLRIPFPPNPSQDNANEAQTPHIWIIPAYPAIWKALS